MQIENVRTRLYRIFERDLANGSKKRYNYGELAEEIGCSRNAVRYNVGVLLRAGFIGAAQGYLYLR